MYVNHDLAKALLDDRRSRAQTVLLRRRLRLRTEPGPRPDAGPSEDAEVIELVFGTHCDAGQIGA